MEQTNARFVESRQRRCACDGGCVVISLKILLPVIRDVFPHSPQPSPRRGDIIALIKPQFEAGRKDVARGDGVIRAPEIHKQVLLDVLGFAQREGFLIRALIKSPLLGPKGNAEFLVWLNQASVEMGGEDLNPIVEQVLEKSQGG